MPTFAECTPKSIVWVTRGISHRAVVLRSTEKFVVLIETTTRKDFPSPCVPVDHFKRAGKAMGLTAPTYFYQSNIYVVYDAAKITSIEQRCRCPHNVFFDLEELLEQAIVAKVAAVKALQPAATTEPEKEAASVAPPALVTAASDPPND